MYCQVIGKGVAPVVCAALLAWGSAAHAITLDLDSVDVPDFADLVVNDGDTASVGNITLTFSNILDHSGGNVGFVDSDGPAFGTQFADDIVSVGLTFNRTVRIVSYDIDFVGAGTTPGATFTLTGPNGTSAANPFDSVGNPAFDAGTIPAFLAGQEYTLTHTVAQGFVQLDELEISVVPLPAPFLLLLSGIGGLVLVGRRRAAN